MAQKTTLVLFTLLLGAGFLLGTFFGGVTIGQLAIPQDHKAIVEDLKLYDNHYGYFASATPLYSKTLSMGEPFSVIGKAPLDFTGLASYQFSLWSFQRKGDTEMTLEIWGPDNTGKGFALVFSRLGLGNGGHIEYKGVTVLEIHAYDATNMQDNLNGWSTEGEYVLDIKVD